MNAPPGARVRHILGSCRPWDRQCEPLPPLKRRRRKSATPAPCPICGDAVTLEGAYCLGCCRVHEAMDGPIDRDKNARVEDPGGPTRYEPDDLDGGTSRRQSGERGAGSGENKPLSATERQQLLFLIRQNPTMANDPKVQAFLADHALA